MLKPINEQKPATKNQITNEKPSVIKNANILQGYIGGSMNGGHLRTIAYEPIMAGTRHIEKRIRINMRMLTPATPVDQKLKATFKAYFVPNSRVWDNAEKFTAQKGGSTVTKIKEIPNLGGKTLPVINSFTDALNNVHYRTYLDTDLFRDSWASSYLPRIIQDRTVIGSGNINGIAIALPKISVLPFRGFKAIYNDFERNKEYDTELTEYKGDTVSTPEFYSILPPYSNTGVASLMYQYTIRGKRQNSYYTDYRTELLGEDIQEPTSGTGDLITITEWEKKVAEMRSEAENAQLNDWDIIAKIRGSKKLTEGKVQLLGTKTVGINYQAITQSTYNTNNNVKEEFQVMGVQGAYSYTEIDIPLYQFIEFNEEGYLHITCQVSADTVYEKGIDRTSLNVNVMDIYRPDNKDLKHDVIYNLEKGEIDTLNLMGITGFKRKYSEYFKLPTVIQGDLTTAPIYSTKWTGFGLSTAMEIDSNNYIEEKTETQHSFAFFEQNDQATDANSNGGGGGTPADVVQKKNIWQDYTDLMINDNQAIKNELLFMNWTSPAATQIGKTSNPVIEIKGQNQLFFVGISTSIAELPIDENIRKNYTTWGEK